MSAHGSNGKKPRASRTPYIPPAARVRLKGKNKESTPSPGCNTQGTQDEDSCTRNSEVGSEKRGNFGGSRVNEKSKSIGSSRKATTAVGAARNDSAGAEAATSTTLTPTPLREALERQPSCSPTRKGRDRGQDGGTSKVVSGSVSCRQRSDGAFLHSTAADATRHSPPATQHRREAPDSAQSKWKPRQAWSPYEPPGRRVASFSPCSSSSNESNRHISADDAAAPPSRAKASRETVANEHTKDASVAPEESLRGPATPNTITEPPGCRDAGSARKLSAVGGSEVLVERGDEGAEIDTAVSTGAGTLAARNPPSSHPDAGSGMATYPNESLQKEVPRGGGAALGVKQTPCVFPTGRSISPEQAYRRSQEGRTAENYEKSGGVMPEALATSTSSSGYVSDRTRASNMKEDGTKSNPPEHHAVEAPPMHAHNVEKSVASTLEVRATLEVGARGDISPFTERDTSGTVEVKGSTRMDEKSNNRARNSEVASDKRGNFGGSRVDEKSKSIGCSRKTTTVVGATRNDGAGAAAATTSTPIPTSLPEALERQPSGSPTRKGRDRGQDGGTAKVVSGSISCRQRSDGSFVNSTATNATRRSTPATQHGRGAPGSPQSKWKPRQAWSPYEPPGRRVASSSPRSPHRNDSNRRPCTGVAAAPPSGEKSSREATIASRLSATVPVADEHTKDASVAPEESLRGPATPNTITEPPGCRDAGSARKLSAVGGSEVLMERGDEGAEIDTVMSTEAGTLAARNPPSLHPDMSRGMDTYPNESLQKAVAHGGGAALGVKQTPCVFPTGRSIFPEQARRRSQESRTTENHKKSDGASGEGEGERERGVENGDVIPEALATLTSSSGYVSDRTRASNVKEERARSKSPKHNAGEAPTMHVYDVEKNVASRLEDEAMPEVGARGDISPPTECDTSATAEVEGSAHIDAKSNARSSGCGARDIGVKVDKEESQKKPISKAPVERYIPPNRRRMLDGAAWNADGAAEWMGPLWISRAPIRVRQKERPSDGQTSESSSARSTPTKTAGVVCGGMSAYGANISEYSEQMSREQVEACTALITNFPSALPPGQREPMLEPFHSFGALITWPRPDEALATFATPALARQAVSAKANRSTVLVVELLSNVSVEKRKCYRKIELTSPGRPPADVSSASRLIAGSLGIRRPRERPAGNFSSSKGASTSRSSSGNGVRERGPRKTQAAESTDSWDM